MLDEKLDFIKDLLEHKEGEIHTKTMTLSANILKFAHTTVQLSNISQINVGKIETKVKFPFFALIVAIVSIFLLKMSILLGLLGIVLSVGYIYLVYKNIPADKIYLNLNLNSGNVYNIYFADVDFAEEVRCSIERAFNGLIRTTLNIDMSSENIYEVSGDNNYFNSNNNSGNTDNSIHNSGNNNTGNSIVGHENKSDLSQTIEGMNWKSIQIDLNEVIEALKNDTSKTKIVSKKALEIARTQNKPKFIEYIKSNKIEFTSELFKAVASGVLVETFTKIIQ